MFKILTGAALIFSSLSIRFDVSHEATWNAITNLNSDQQQWDKFFRDSIKALGDSAAK
jgi:hypothetical protein